MDTKTITAVISFTALALVLNPIRIPAIFWPGQYFRLWEIPILVAFLLFGFKIGFSVALLNCTGQLALFRGSTGILGPPWGLILILSMFLGLYLAKKLVARRVIDKKSFLRVKPVVYFTVLGTLSRVMIMPFVDYAIYNSLLPIAVGKSFTQAYIVGLIPFIILFNVIVPLYTIPISYILAKTVQKNLRVGEMLP